MSLYQQCKAQGCDFFVGVPCSNLFAALGQHVEVIKVAPGNEPGIPRIPYPPQEMVARFMAAIRRN
jgi:hypothetical protein